MQDLDWLQVTFSETVIEDAVNDYLHNPVLLDSYALRYVPSGWQERQRFRRAIRELARQRRPPIS